MGFDWSSLAGPFAGLFGGGIDAAVSAKMARDNRAFQERMTRHRYRYQMEDMKAAGLNPMLAFGQSPPGAPPGAMGKGTNFGSSLAATAKTAAEIDNIEQQTATSAQAAKESRERAHTQRSERQRMAWQMALIEQQALGQGLTNIGGKIEADLMQSALGPMLRGLKIAGPGAGAVLGGTGSILGRLLGPTSAKKSRGLSTKLPKGITR